MYDADNPMKVVLTAFMKWLNQPPEAEQVCLQKLYTQGLAYVLQYEQLVAPLRVVPPTRPIKTVRGMAYAVRRQALPEDTLTVLELDMRVHGFFSHHGVSNLKEALDRGKELLAA